MWVEEGTDLLERKLKDDIYTEIVVGAVFYQCGRDWLEHQRRLL